MWGFGSGGGSDVKKYKHSPLLVKTGGLVDNIVVKLLAAGRDKNTDVREAVARSIHSIALKQPLLALTQSIDFIETTKNIDAEHRHFVTKCVKKFLPFILSGTISEFMTEKLVKAVIAFGVRQMTLQGASNAQQQSCSAILVIMATHYADDVISELLEKYTPGVLPHYFVMKTLQDVAESSSISFVPFLKEVLSRTIPVLGLVKKETDKWLFTAALGKFSRAALTYSEIQLEENKNQKIFHDKKEEEQEGLQDFKRRTDPNLDILHDISSGMASAFDVVFTNWRLSKQKSVLEACHESIGLLCRVMDKDKFKQNYEKLVSSYLQAYKKTPPKDRYPITSGFRNCLFVGAQEGMQDILDQKEGRKVQVLSNILTAIHPFVCTPPNLADSNSLKNSKLLLESFAIIARTDFQRVLSFLFDKLRGKEPKPKIGSLVVLRHYINQLDEYIVNEDRKSTILSGLLCVTNESSYSVKANFLSVITSLAERDYLGLEGADKLMTFLVESAAISDAKIKDFDQKMKGKRPADPNAHPEALRNAADKVLKHLASKVVGSHKVLWPYLFECVLPEKFRFSLGSICRCIGVIGAYKRANDIPDYYIDFKNDPHLPDIQDIFGKLIVDLTEPHLQRHYGLALFYAIRNIGPLVNAKAATFWDTIVPKLEMYVKSNIRNHDQEKWEGILLKFVSQTAEKIDDEKQLMVWGNSIVKHFGTIPKGKSNSLRRSMCFQLVGILLQNIARGEFVRNKVSWMIEICDNKDSIQQRGCAHGCGLASFKHLDTTLEAIRLKISTGGGERKKGGLFGFGGKMEVVEAPPTMKTTLINGLGFIAKCCPTKLFLSRVENGILANGINSTLNAPNLAKLPRQLHFALVNAIMEVSDALHPSKLLALNDEKIKNFEVKDRDNLLEKILVIMNSSQSYNLRLSCVKAIGKLLDLRPKIHFAAEIRAKILPSMFDYAVEEKFNKIKVIEAAVTPASKQKKKSAAEGQKSKNLSKEEIDVFFEAVFTVLAKFLENDGSLDSFKQIIDLSTPSLISSNSNERLRAMQLLNVLLKKEIEVMLGSKKEIISESFYVGIGGILSVLCARLGDSSPDIRSEAASGLQSLLYIDQLIRNIENKDPSPDIKSISALKTELCNRDKHRHRIEIYAKFVTIFQTAILQQEFQEVLSKLIERLLDSEPSSAQTCLYFVMCLIKLRPVELKQHAGNMSKQILDALSSLGDRYAPSEADQKEIDPCTYTYVGGLKCLDALAEFHFTNVVNELFERKLPISCEVAESFRTLSRGKQGEQLLINALQRLGDTPIREGEPTPVLILATNLIEVVCKIQNSPVVKNLMDKFYLHTFAALVGRIGTANTGVKGTGPADCVNALKALFILEEEKDILEDLDGNNAWELLQKPDYTEGVLLLSASVSKSRNDQSENVFRAMVNFLSKHYPQQRNAATVYISGMIAAPAHKENVRLLLAAAKQLLPRVADKNAEVRENAIIGLGNLKDSWSEELSPCSSSVVSALTSSMEDGNESVASTAVGSLIKVLAVVDEQVIAPNLVNICFRMHAAFDRKNENMRTSAFDLFTALCRFRDGIARKNLLDQIHVNIPTYCVHMNDESATVREACLRSFRVLADVLEVEPLMFFLLELLGVEKRLVLME